ncbi:AEC family transporter [Pasteurella dagmatis]|uniref:Transporter, auxin efflux carrier (AEC) family protein n=1 Tax=Pasteurella dagmatis ATCC 43325 TaxID=667128 RepID=C9PQB5_9PAST|nr:AEC family transporter [Pasteurella dagmatis]EEX50226.1 transporter, auxin efflux carrier (AEC) family protein [Pasteurella dagmatis ATCC 43325]SNV58927.1 auxin efflux carrier family protein [Pasteurella dagmatis]
MNNADFFSSFGFSMSVTMPTVFMLVLGIVLRKRKMIDDKFTGQATKIIFMITLPFLLFLNIISNPVDYRSQLLPILASIVGTLILFVSAELFAAKYIPEKQERGTFVQSVYRGNNGILGLALCINAYGEAGLAPASIYAAATIFLFNVLGVITLSRSFARGKVSWWEVLKNVVKNPLIIAIVLGYIVNVLELSLPKTLLTTGNYLASMTLPLALICTGASIRIKGSFFSSSVVMWGSFARVLIAPIFMVIVGKLFGLSGMQMGILFLMAATPMATVVYTMVRGMGGDGTNAANVIALTTLGAIITSSLGLMILTQLGWV